MNDKYKRKYSFHLLILLLCDKLFKNFFVHVLKVTKRLKFRKILMIQIFFSQLFGPKQKKRLNPNFKFPSPETTPIHYTLNNKIRVSRWYLRRPNKKNKKKAKRPVTFWNYPQVGGMLTILNTILYRISWISASLFSWKPNHEVSCCSYFSWGFLVVHMSYQYFSQYSSIEPNLLGNCPALTTI